MIYVLFLHLDGTLPNIALMRLAAWHRAQGHHVELRRCEWKDKRGRTVVDPSQLAPRLGDPPVWDYVYGSLIFERTRPLAAEAARQYPQIVLGGTGWDFVDGTQVRNTELPGDAGAAPLDYSVYPDAKASYGFTQRGCRFRCSHCVVPRKEGAVTPAATLAELWRGDPYPKQIVLLDNDFFGNPNWRAIIAEAKAGAFKLAVIQGINARTLNDEQAQAIASVPWMAGNFARRRVYTAWDHRRDERVLFRGLRRLESAGISPDSMLVYVLIGHEPGETHADRDHRRAALRAFGARPYPMPFVRHGELGEELVAFQSWCIQRKDQSVAWGDWWGKAKGNVRRLGTRRVSLPLFGEDA